MKNIHDQYSIFGKNHGAKSKDEQKGVRKYMKKYERTNKNRGVKAEIRGK